LPRQTISQKLRKEMRTKLKEIGVHHFLGISLLEAAGWAG